MLGIYVYLVFDHPVHQELESQLDEMEGEIRGQIRKTICSELGVDEKRITKAIEAREKNKDRTSSDGLSTLNEIFLDPEEFLK